MRPVAALDRLARLPLPGGTQATWHYVAAPSEDASHPLFFSSAARIVAEGDQILVVSFRVAARNVRVVEVIGNEVRTSSARVRPTGEHSMTIERVGAAIRRAVNK